MVEQLSLIEPTPTRRKIFTGPDQEMLWEMAQVVAAFPAGYFCPFCRSMGAAHKVDCIVIKARELVLREDGVE